MLSPEIEKALNASEFLALDNVILARRAAEAERQLERERRGHTGGTSIMGALLLGWFGLCPGRDDPSDPNEYS